MIVGSPTILNLVPGGVMKCVHVNQVNKNIEIQFKAMNGAAPYNVPEGVTCTIRGTKGDAFGYAAEAAVTVGSNVITVTLTEQLTAVAGAGNIFELVFVGAADDMKVSTENFILAVERQAMGEDTVISDSDLSYAEQVLDSLQNVAAVNAQVQQNKTNLAAEISRAQAAEAAEAAARQAADNTLQSNINAEASTRATQDASLQAQIDQLIAPSGSAPSAAEVENARVGADGTTYPTLGDAIRTQVTDVKSALEETVLSRYGETQSPNIIIGGDESVTPGYISKNGSIHSGTTLAYTDYLPVTEGDKLRTYYTRQGAFVIGNLRFVCAYDENKNAISSAGFDTSIPPGSYYEVPAGIAFVRVSITYTASGSTATSRYMVSLNCVPTEYSAYVEPVRTITENFLTPESAEYLEGLMESGISSTDIGYNHACAFPKGYSLRQTVGLPESWYYKSAVTPYTPSYVDAGTSYSKRYNDYCHFPNLNASSSVNGFSWRVYDIFLNQLDAELGSAGYGMGRKIVAENLSDCTLLAIGDSTVDHDAMTATMLSHFAEQGHTLTLLGTLGDGSGTNRNEGRAGWKASDYFTNRQYNGVVNPFYNPSTQTFDFGYYMTNQGYTAPDFVVIQLGINDLYNSVLDSGIIETTWGYISQMIQSIRTYNNGIKILLNLPTTPNSDQSAHTNVEFLYRNVIVRYNEYALSNVLSEFGVSAVRPTYCHLILDPDTDIRDNVHPTAEGYAKMGLEVINQINCWQNGY